MQPQLLIMEISHTEFNHVCDTIGQIVKANLASS